jgi:hypothetical protein
MPIKMLALSALEGLGERYLRKFVTLNEVKGLTRATTAMHTKTNRNNKQPPAPRFPNFLFSFSENLLEMQNLRYTAGFF